VTPPELLELGEELRTVFTDERRAIAALDHARLEQLAGRKPEHAGRLAALAAAAAAETAAAEAAGDPAGDPATRALFAALRVEAHATALLAAAAAEAVRALLGYETTGGYDRRARPLTAAHARILAAY
jgi:hypothetical protein